MRPTEIKRQSLNPFLVEPTC